MKNRKYRLLKNRVQKYRIRKYRINIKGTLVTVKKRVYLFYFRSKRRDKYFEHDIKIGTPIKDKSGNIIGFMPSKEDSLDRLMDLGSDFTDGRENVEDAAIRNIRSDKLHMALAKLPDEDAALIEAIYFRNSGKGMTVRGYAEVIGIPYQTVHSRKKRILVTLRKLMEK